MQTIKDFDFFCDIGKILSCTILICIKILGKSSWHSGWRAGQWHYSNEFEFQSHYYIYFRTNTIGESFPLPHQLLVK